MRYTILWDIETRMDYLITSKVLEVELINKRKIERPVKYGSDRDIIIIDTLGTVLKILEKLEKLEIRERMQTTLTIALLR